MIMIWRRRHFNNGNLGYATSWHCLSTLTLFVPLRWIHTSEHDILYRSSPNTSLLYLHYQGLLGVMTSLTSIQHGKTSLRTKPVPLGCQTSCNSSTYASKSDMDPSSPVHRCDNNMRYYIVSRRSVLPWPSGLYLVLCCLRRRKAQSLSSNCATKFCHFLITSFRGQGSGVRIFIGLESRAFMQRVGPT